MPPWTRQVLTEEGLHHVATHKYKGGAYTPLDNLLNPWWCWLTTLLPTWLAPNLVTLAGFTPLAACYLLGWFSSPDGITPLPRWLTGGQALALFFYQTMDAMDGKQARRIGLSTPMGQLFDHGFDCLGALSFHSVAWAFWLCGRSRWMVAAQSIPQLSFFMAQWQERYTGVLQTSWGSFGVTESQYGLMLVAAANTAMGPERTQALMGTPVSVPVVGPTTVGILLTVPWVVFNLVLQTLCVRKMISACLTGSTDREEEDVPASQDGPPGTGRLVQAAQDLVPSVVLAYVALLLKPSIYIMSPRLFIYLNSMLAFHVTAKMILLNMARQSFPVVQLGLVPYVFMIVASHFTSDENTELFLLGAQLYAAILTIHVGFWLFSAIQQLKVALNIYVLSTQKMEAHEDKKVK